MRHFKTIGLLIGVILMTTVFNGCGPDTPSVSYDETLLYGEWMEGTVHDVYKSDGTGYTWDPSEDISEEEASPFTWSLSYDQLLITHTLWNGTIVPKTYTITTLNERTLILEDAYGNSHEYERCYSL